MNHSPKKQALLEAATELFAEDGFWQTTTASIAKDAGCRHRDTLYILPDQE